MRYVICINEQILWKPIIFCKNSSIGIAWKRASLDFWNIASSNQYSIHSLDEGNTVESKGTLTNQYTSMPLAKKLSIIGLRSSILNVLQNKHSNHLMQTTISHGSLPKNGNTSCKLSSSRAWKIKNLYYFKFFFRME